MEDADKGRVDRPVVNPTLTQLKNTRANAKRQVTRLVNRVDASIKRRENYEEIQEDESLLVTLLGLATESQNDYVSSLDLIREIKRYPGLRTSRLKLQNGSIFQAPSSTDVRGICSLGRFESHSEKQNRSMEK